MLQNRIYIFPFAKTNERLIKATGRDGTTIETPLECNDQNIKLGSYKYSVFVGSTPGRKGYPNQDFAGLGQKDFEIGNKSCNCLLTIVADGVSSKGFSEITSESIVKTTIDNFSKTTRKYSSFRALATDLWSWISEGAQKQKLPHGLSTVSLFFLASNGEEIKGIAINCGDSRVYWATPKYVESARVHTEVLNPRNAISYALGEGRINKKIYHDIYFIDNPVEIFLCTDTFAYVFDGVHFPEEMIPTFEKAIPLLSDNLTAISVKRI